MPDQQSERYSFPTIIRSGMKPSMHVLYLFFIAFFFAFPVFFIVSGNLQFDTTLILCCLIFVLMGLTFLTMWLYTGVLKCGRIQLEEDRITVKSVFSTKHARWVEIGAVQPYMQNSHHFIGITTEQKLKKQKETFRHSLSAAFGGTYSFAIPLSAFPSADGEKLFATIYSMMKESGSNTDQISDPASDTFDVAEPHPKSTGGALFKAFLIFIAGVILNGIVLYFFNTAFLAIPLMTDILIIYIFSYYKNTETSNALAKLVLGLLCALSFLTAAFSVLFPESSAYLQSFGLWKTIGFNIQLMKAYPRDLLSYYVYAALFFLFATLSGSHFPFLRKLHAAFMKKQNGCLLEKDSGFVTIYLTDYAHFRDDGKLNVEIEPNQCKIELDGKKLNAFSIPAEIFEKNRLSSYGFEKVTLSDKAYYRLDLGGRSEPRTYGFACLLILNESNEPEVIRLQIR